MAVVLVSFHAHPDDEALLTAGTLARAAAQGHRVVVVTATDGEAGLTSPDVAGCRGTCSSAGPGSRAARLLDAATVARLAAAYSDGRELTHRVDVRPWAGVKRAALRAHASQAVGGSGPRTVAGRHDDVFAGVRGLE